MNPAFATRLQVLAPALLVAACSPFADREADADPARQQLLETIGEVGAEASPDDCLLYVWSGEEDPDIEFDRAHDVVKGGAISCATGTSASQFDAAIAALREAAKSGNKARMLEEVGIPLLYIDAAGNRREIEQREEVEAVFDEIFDPPMLDRLQQLDLSHMTVAKDQGAFFDLGAIWLVVDEDGGRPRLMTVNRQALDEALEAARDQAERNEGEALPFD